MLVIFGHRGETPVKLKLSKIACILVSCTMVSISLPAKTTFKTLARFDITDGYSPSGPIIQGTDGSFYGATWSGGSSYHSAGTIFKITPAGVLTTLYNFCSLKNCTDGAYPNGLMQAADGDFYGTTNSGGANICDDYGCGTVFKITPSGQLTTLHNFCSERNCKDGWSPCAGLVQGVDGSFYSTTYRSGDTGGAGSVFKITSEGKFTTLYRFSYRFSSSGYRHGVNVLGGLVQGADRNFYGTTSAGGSKANYAGTIFKITPSGKLTTLHSFAGYPTDGGYPRAALVQASDKNFYGSTPAGGSNGDCSGGCGTIFKITPSGKLTTLYNFCAKLGCIDGVEPIAELVQATDGNLYGTTTAGGLGFVGDIDGCYIYDENEGCGTIFRVTDSGKLTTLYRFCAEIDCTDGANPLNGLLQTTDGIFYGTTNSYSGGTVFSLNLEPRSSEERGAVQQGRAVTNRESGLRP
jgi:uncharacterized repeat protein (TIGR03803 family)